MKQFAIQLVTNFNGNTPQEFNTTKVTFAVNLIKFVKLTILVPLLKHLNWEIRDQYLELLENYREEKIDSFNFRIRFCERYGSIEKVANLLESNQVLLSPDENALDFGDLLSEIDSCCKPYLDDPETFRNKFEIGDVEFRISIEKIYFKIQKFLNEE